MRQIAVSVFSLCMTLALPTGCKSQKEVSNPQMQGSPGMAVTFAAACGEDRTVWLTSTLSNTGPARIELPSGGLPWHYDGTGASLEVSTSSSAIARREVFPEFQPVGPDTLAPGETRNGTLPFEFLYPGIAEHLGKEDVLVDWTYSTQSRGHPGVQASGRLVMKEDPCRR